MEGISFYRTGSIISSWAGVLKLPDTGGMGCFHLSFLHIGK